MDRCSSATLANPAIGHIKNAPGEPGALGVRKDRASPEHPGRLGPGRPEAKSCLGGIRATDFTISTLDRVVGRRRRLFVQS